MKLLNKNEEKNKWNYNMTIKMTSNATKPFIKVRKGE